MTTDFVTEIIVLESKIKETSIFVLTKTSSDGSYSLEPMDNSG